MKARSTLFLILLTIAFLFAKCILVCLFRLFVYFPKPKDPTVCKETDVHLPIVGSQELIDRFIRAIQYKTITKGKYNYDKDELNRFIEFIRKSFPRIHSSPFIKVERIANYSLLYTIAGRNPKLKPFMICSHLDVVPVERDKWFLDPFAGTVKDGYIYGRGTIDTRSTLIPPLEALEHLLHNSSYIPQRPFYFAFGHDEEGTGVEGAFTMAKTLKERGVQLEYLLDEGPTILNGSIPGVDALVGLVGVAEKGFLTVRLDVFGEAGHSSMPPYETTIVTLSKAVSKLNSHVFPSRFGSGPERGLLEALVPYASFPFNIIYSNFWLFGSLFSKYFSQTPFGNALVRTTTGVTMMRGGVKENVLSSSCYAVINHRIHPSDNVAQVMDYVTKVIDDDRVLVSVYEGQSFEPHPISPYDDNAFGYQVIKDSVREIFPEVVVAPSMMLAGTDTKWYLELTRNIYRFRPVILKPEELKMLHGHNERVGVDNYVKVVNYYHHLLLSSDNDFLPRKNFSCS